LIFGPGGNILLGEAYLFADIVSSFFGENPEWRTRRWLPVIQSSCSFICCSDMRSKTNRHGE